MSDNPFTPPESDIRTPNPEVRESIWWKIYFVACALLTLFAFISIAFIDAISMSVYDYIDTAVWLIAMVGLFGFVFSIRIGYSRMWIILFFIVLANGLFYTIVLPAAGIPRFGEVTQLDIWYSVDIAFSLVLWWALYLYSFKRENLWINAK